MGREADVAWTPGGLEPLVPIDDHDVLMKGLDILRDWAGDVGFDPVEVDKERGSQTTPTSRVHPAADRAHSATGSRPWLKFR